MNSVALALDRAARTARTAGELPAAFDRAWADLEFSGDSETAVLPVDLATARLWWFGEKEDVELALSVTRQVRAIWWAALPRRACYRAGLEAVRSFVDQGASVLFLQTRNLPLARHAIRHGCRPNEIEPGLVRLCAERPALTRWLRL